MEIQLIIAFGFFFFALGACVGSFLNVVIWRLPYRGREVIFKEKRGKMTLSWPPSHCPVCDAGIHWYHNIPVLSWIMLRAQCANCKTHIPVRYPLVELGTALLFLGFYLAYFLGHWQPGFSDPRDHQQAFAFALHLAFVAALLVASAIDADRYEIPLEIPWFLMAIGIAGWTFIDHPVTRDWSINPLTTWWLAKPVAAAGIGLVVSNILLMLKILPRGYAFELEQLERMEREKAAASAHKKGQQPEPPKEEPMAPLPKLTRFGRSAIAVVILLGVIAACWAVLPAKPASLITLVVGIVVFLIGILARDSGQADFTDDVVEEVATPFARAIVLREIPFLMVPVVFAVVAGLIPFDLPPHPWLARLLGSVLGLLVGGGIVWGIRILGTLGLNKIAMGEGDAHLMAGVGAVVGAPLVIIAFFTAPFVALMWAAVLKITGKPNVLPYGPWLSVAAILSLFVGNPLLQYYLSMIFPAVALGFLFI